MRTELSRTGVRAAVLLNGAVRRSDRSITTRASYLLGLAVTSAAASLANAQCSVLFAPAVVASTAPGPFSVALGDVNGDGRRDVVVGYSYSNIISVFINGGNNVLLPRVDYPLPATVTNYCIAVQRVNGDTAPDVVCGTSAGLQVLLNNGDGAFGAATVYAPSHSLRQIGLADFNSDGTFDVAAADASPDSPGVTVFLNTDGILSNAPVTYPTPMPATGMAAFLYDAGGNRDIFVNGAGTSGLYRLHGLGNGTFQAPQLAIAGIGGQFLSHAPQMGPAMLLYDQASQSVRVLEDRGHGLANDYTIPVPGGGAAWNCAAGRLTSDNNDDMVALSYNAGMAQAYTGGGQPFQPPVPYILGGTGPMQIALGDLNGDAMPDAVITNGNTASLSILLNRGGPMILQSPHPQSAVVGGTALLTVVATNATGYTWYRGLTLLTDGGHFSGVNTATLTVSGVTEYETGTYYCVVAGPCNANTATTLSLGQSGCIADVGVAGGGYGHDGVLDNNDFVSFINLFFSGCP